MKKLWMMCPFSRPEQAAHVEKIWTSQSIDCNLLIIANACIYEGKCTQLITLNEKGAVNALNTGLEYLRA